MQRFDLLIFVARGNFLRLTQRFLGFYGHFFKLHLVPHFILCRSCWTVRLRHSIQENGRYKKKGRQLAGPP
jgi:hypothetical protein